MVTNGGFLVTKIKQLGDRIFEKVLAEKGVDADPVCPLAAGRRADQNNL